MRRSILVLLGLFVLMAVGAPSAGARSAGSLDMYAAKVSAAKATQLIRKGWDISDVTPTRRGTRIDIVLSRAQAASLRRSGVRLRQSIVFVRE